MTKDSPPVVRRRLRKRPRNDRTLLNNGNDKMERVWERNQAEVTFTPVIKQPPIPHWATDEPEIAQSCLFIPIVLAAWWYWTKKVARTVVREVITQGSACPNPSASEAEDDENEAGGNYGSPFHGNNKTDEFNSWDEVVQNQAAVPDRSVRFVRWVRNKKLSGSERIKAMTKRAMRTNPQKRRQLDDPAKNVPMLRSNNRDASCTGDSEPRAVTWEYISDVSSVEVFPAARRHQGNSGPLVELVGPNSFRERPVAPAAGVPV